jgi:predicted ester cyclase
MATGSQLVRRLWEDVFPHCDLALCDELFAVSYVEHALAPFGSEAPGHVNGPEHMRGVVTWLRAQFPDFVAVIEAMVEDGDTTAVRIRSEGTNDGPLNGVVPPTGRRFSAAQTHWYRIEDGRLAEHWATRDDLTMLLQLGLVPRPARP